MDIKWVITKSNIETAIKYLNTKIPKKSSLSKDIAVSLSTYKTRGEFDGSLESAIKCLKQAEYEIEDEV